MSKVHSSNTNTSMINRSINKIKNHSDIFLAFAMPIAVLSIAFMILGIYPFGSRNIINSDLYVQFAPIMNELKRTVASDGSILYSFNGGLGTNFYAINTYQNASPLTWLFLALFPERLLVLSTTLLFMTKTGLASASMYYYLKSRFDMKAGPSHLDIRLRSVPQASSHERDKDGAGSMIRSGAQYGAQLGRLPWIALSSVYALSGYVIAFYCNLMWLECVILLPLIVLGMRRAIDDKRYKLYVISMALMLFTSYYIGLMIYFFLYVYFFVCFFSEHKKAFLKTFLRIRALSILAVLLSMAVLLPTYYALTKTGNYESMSEGSSSLFYYSLPTHLAQIFPGSKVTMNHGPANLYSGLMTILLCSMYIFNKTIDKREKIAKVLFVIFVFFCTNFAPIDVAWQLGHPPNGFPNRYSFVFSFLTIELAAESIVSLRGLGNKAMRISFIFPIAIYLVVLAGSISEDDQNRFLLIFGAAILALYAFMFLIMGMKNTKEWSLLFVAVIMFELVANTTYGLGAGGIVDSNRLLLYKDEVSEMIEKTASDDPDARLEIIGTDNYNAPYLYGYKGASIFASSVPGDTLKVLNGLWDDPIGNSRIFTYRKPNVVADTIANIDYYISFDRELDIPWADELTRTKHCYLYKSRFPTSIGYMVPIEMTGLDFDGPQIDTLNGFIRFAVGNDVPTGEVDDHVDAGSTDDVTFAIKDPDNIDLSKWEKTFSVIYDELLEINEMDGNRLSGSIAAKEDGLFMTSIPYDDGWIVTVDGERVNDINSVGYFISFPLSAGRHTVKMTYMPPKLITGLIISVSSLLISLCAIIITSKRRGGKTDE